MTLERILGGGCDPPFPVYAHLADDLVARTQRRQSASAMRRSPTCSRRVLRTPILPRERRSHWRCPSEPIRC